MTEVFKRKFMAIALPLGCLSGISLALIFLRLAVTGSTRYWFLPWNLLLAWIPLILAFAVTAAARRYRWTSWQWVTLFVAWLVFLPNTFYIVTDLVHLHETGEVSVLYDAVMMSLFSLIGILLGFTSLLLIEKELRRGLSRRIATAVVLGVILLCSFAIYLGRYLRWNSWDVVTSPGSLFLDVADRIVRPHAHPLSLTTTLLFFVFISSLYFGLKLFVAGLKKLEK